MFSRSGCLKIASGYLLIVLSAWLSARSLVAFADDLVPNRGEFYPRGHAAGVGQQNTGNPTSPGARTPRPDNSTVNSADLAPPSDNPSEKSGFVELESGASEQGGGQGEVVESDVALDPLPVSAIGLVIDCSSPEVVSEGISSLESLLSRFDLASGDVLLVGCTNPPSGDSVMRIAARGGILRMVGKPPQEFNLKRSPSWILSTSKGLVILDGVKDPKRYLNSKGQFVERQ